MEGVRGVRDGLLAMRTLGRRDGGASGVTILNGGQHIDGMTWLWASCRRSSDGQDIGIELGVMV